MGINSLWSQPQLAIRGCNMIYKGFVFARLVHKTSDVFQCFLF